MPLTYTLKRSTRARALRLAVYPDGEVVVTAPARLHLGIVEQFIQQKVSWIEEKLAYVKKKGIGIYIKTTPADFTKHKPAALALVEEKLQIFNVHYKFTYHRIAVRNQKSRWGSCSKKGNLNFNYKIALLPERLVDYIVVHELCHVQEFNHSANFWSLVTETIPNHKALRAELKKYRF